MVQPRAEGGWKAVAGGALNAQCPVLNARCSMLREAAIALVVDLSLIIRTEPLSVVGSVSVMRSAMVSAQGWVLHPGVLVGMACCCCCCGCSMLAAKQARIWAFPFTLPAAPRQPPSPVNSPFVCNDALKQRGRTWPD